MELGSTRACTILVVASDGPDRALAADAIVRCAPQGTRVVCAASLADALPRLRSCVFDVALIGLDLPDSSGLATLERILEQRPQAALIALLDREDDDAGLAAIGHGAVDYVFRSELGTRALARAVRAAMDAEQLRARKLEAVRRLAGGISHHFNNLLTIQLGFARMLMQSDRLDEPGRHQLQEVLNAAERARVITQHLVRFCGDGDLDEAPVDVNEVVHRLEPTLRGLLGDRIQLELDLSGDLRPVQVDRLALEQSVLILGLNGRDAMCGEGRLTISTRLASVGDRAHVVLTVADQGPGIAAHVQQRMFEPFFTTKDVGEGLGLGLAAVQGVARSAGGFVEVRSPGGRGAALSINLPVTKVASG